MLHLLTSAQVAQILPEAAPSFTRSEILTMIALGLGLVYFIGNRINAVRDRNHAKREAQREQAVKERTEKIKKLEAAAAEQQTKNTGYQQEIEHMRDEIIQMRAELKGALETGRDNRQKIDNVKETLARIESQLSTLLGTLLQRP